MIKVVLISGKARAGKSTSAKQAITSLRSTTLNAEIYSFATEVKRIARDVFGWNGIKDEAGRILLTDIGKIMRKYNPTFWVDFVINEMCNTLRDLEGNKIAIIDDWRFVNEHDQMCRTFGKDNVLTLRIERDDIPKATPDDYFDANDETETELDDYPFDLTMPNNHCLEELKSQLGYLVKQHNFFNIGV